MTDKSFGDYHIRNTTKNPLLSTAVTGLSIEDLSQNAVLLPVVTTQGPEISQDQAGTQDRTLEPPQHNTANFPSGDASFKNILPQSQIINNLNTSQNQQNVRNDRSKQNPFTPEPKLEDDFDVSEYFARLQGTRYVSAPLNVKDDQNLQATEDNLEEINLNEPDKSTDVDETQQSLTADIAQNFSQLPTVLPQVASAVFSSFSNMLYKSREQTPEVKTSSQYQVLEHHKTGEPTLQIGMVPCEEVKEVAPPPREPPIGGAVNYRISTKKKAYAHVPGLSSGDASRDVPPYKLPNFSQTNAPSYFVPETDSINLQPSNLVSCNIQNIPDYSELEQNIINPFQQHETQNKFYTLSKLSSRLPSNTNEIESNESMNDISTYKSEVPIFSAPSTMIQTPTKDACGVPVQSSSSIIPPPLMFSNVPKKEIKLTEGKSILPPSIARRISANHPIIKSQAPVSNLPCDIFTPSSSSYFNPLAASTEQTTITKPTFKTEVDPKELVVVAPPSMFMPQMHDIQKNSKPSLSVIQSLAPLPTLDSNTTCILDNLPHASSLSSIQAVSEMSPSNLLSALSSSQISVEDNIPISSKNFIPSSNIAQPCIEKSTIKPTKCDSDKSDISVTNIVKEQVETIFTGGSLYNCNIQPHDFQRSTFNPALIQTLPPINPSTAKEITEIPSSNNLRAGNTVTDIQTVPEPPKIVSGSLSYRMPKKRPQYYSGPIEGVGSLSIKAKPTFPPDSVKSDNYQGILFTPLQEDITDISTNQNLVPQIECSAPFDITNVSDNVTLCEPLNVSQDNSYMQYNYNTVFDMSRQKTVSCTSITEETKGFGIIGSLKSKLSSIDINKIQNSVTTFFDPAYNNVTKETLDVHKNLQYPESKQNLALGSDVHNHSHIDILIPNEESQQPYHGSDQNYLYNFNVQANQYYPIEESNLTRVEPINQFPTHSASSFVPDQNAPTQCYSLNNVNTHAFENVQINPMIFLNPSTFETESLAPKMQETLNISTKTEFNPYIPDFTNDTNNIISNNEYEKLKIYTDTDLTVTNLVENQPFRLEDLNEKLSNLNLSKENSIVEAIIENESNSMESHNTDLKSSINVSVDNLHLDYNKKDLKKNDGFVSTLSEPEVNIFDIKNIIVQNPEIQSTIQPLASYASHNSLPVFATDENVLDKENLSSLGNVDTNKVLETNIFEGISKDKEVDEPFFNHNLSSMRYSGHMSAAAELHIPSVRGNMENQTLTDTATNQTKRNAEFFNKIDFIEKEQLLSDSFENDDVSDLGICETCREVNKTHDTELDHDGLTAQLIENITAPIQLLNPVEVPLTESNKVTEEEFDLKQCAEISHITEETIGSIHIKSATELLEDDQVSGGNSRIYGWRDSYFPDPVSAFEYTNKQFSVTNIRSECDYSLQPNVNAIGFFGECKMLSESLPSNASDEIKAGLMTCHEESIIILPRQMSIPTAPPEEEIDDIRSDETGILDVNSIELDAKKDFPIFDEFLIEPSETDDDKIEFREREKSDDSTQRDTFTNRVEQFKKLEVNAEVQRLNENLKEVEKNLQIFDVPTTNSPVVPIASYFDTGNYAVESHYRNLMISPMSTSNGGKQNSLLRFPPGFEEEYQKKLRETFSVSSSKDDKKDDFRTKVPDTGTQTRLSPSVTFTSAKQMRTNIGIKDDSKNIFEPYIPETSTQTKLSPTMTYNLAQELGDKNETTVSHTITSSPFVAMTLCKTTENLPGLATEARVEMKTEENMPPNCAIRVSTAVAQISNVTVHRLPDPINFFSSNVESNFELPQDNGFNRLASYFTSPPKTDHTKSFFELSQSQNHYRHELGPSDIDSKSSDMQKSFFQLSQSENHYMDSKNISDDRYLVNLNLIKDLTSCNNLEFNSKEQVVRTVNYFTVEYNNQDILKPFVNIGEPDKFINKDEKSNTNHSNLDEIEPSLNILNTELEEINTIESIIMSCKYCFNLCTKTLIYGKDINIINEFNDLKLKKAMDAQDPDVNREKDLNMEQGNHTSERSDTVTFDMRSVQEEPNDGVSTMFENRSTTEYTPVKHHWFYRVDCDGKSIWRGFSMADSVALENAFNSPELSEQTLVATDGGRFDVNVVGRLRISVYWSDKPTNVRRCSWFYKGTTDARYVPYTEQVANKLEEEYRHGITTGEWHRRLMLANNEMVVMHGPQVMVHFLQATSDAFTAPNQSTMRPRVVRRGHHESEIEDPEPSSIDHLLLLCHGVGSACDMRFRSVEEVVDDFRATSLQLVQSHYKNSFDSGAIGRVEVLPISWHSTLHSGEGGVDKRLAQITLDSIPRLRNFTNDTVLDVLFYTSPIFCQTIIDTVCKELNRVHSLFLARNPTFRGGVSLGGHSLGSVILYDLLCHQPPPSPTQMSAGCPDPAPGVEKKVMTGTAGTGQLTVKYPRLEFAPSALYALGSPIAIFECIRGVESLGKRFRLPTCDHFFNIFHPYDPIAYRIEPLIDPELKLVKPHLIPHHKGRKRMHLELKDTMARVGADLKQKLVESIKATWSSMWRTQPPPNSHLEKVVEEELEKQSLTEESRDEQAQISLSPEMVGALNGGRRVDYVLQEAPFEMINEYLFAMSSHVCYWESEDTMLMMLREIYDALGVQPDCTVPQQSMTVQRTRTVREDTVLVTSEHASASASASTSRDAAL